LPEQRSGCPDASPVTWEDPATIPSDARFAHQRACIKRESQNRSDEGTRSSVARLRSPGRGIQRVPIPYSAITRHAGCRGPHSRPHERPLDRHAPPHRRRLGSSAAGTTTTSHQPGQDAARAPGPRPLFRPRPRRHRARPGRGGRCPPARRPRPAAPACSAGARINVNVQVKDSGAARSLSDRGNPHSPFPRTPFPVAALPGSLRSSESPARKE
jgi:hypothetical protein